jgi:uncharacterized membrane protein
MWWPSVVLAALGFVDAAYLTWIKLTGGAVACSNVGDCEVVNNSRFAVIGGVPIALLGAGTYLLILVLLGLERSNPAAGETTRMAVFGFSLVGTLYSAYLTYVELAILKAICPYCVASSIILTLLLALSIIRLRQPWVEES